MSVDWFQILKNMPNICGGGTLCAIVYCCPHDCPIRNLALKRLGISKSDYLWVKNRLGLRHSGVCWRNLAYCCSPLKPCSKRDSALQELGMSMDDYVKFKISILEELLKYVKCPVDDVVKVRLVYTYFGFLYVPEIGKELRVVGHYVPDLRLVMPSIVLEVLDNEDVRVKIASTYQPVPVYLPTDLVNRINEVVPRLGKGTFTEFVTEAVKEKLQNLLKRENAQ